jgi:hypothetical protein
MSLQHTSQRCFAPLNWDAVIPLLLVMLPNLETFETHSFVGPGLITFVRKELMGKDFALAATRQRQLPSSHSNTDDNYAMSRLKTVSMTMLPEEADGGLLQSILPIVQLPSLTTFTCTGMNDDGVVLQHETPSNILNLTFKDVFLDSVSLAHLLPLFPHRNDLSTGTKSH